MKQNAPTPAPAWPAVLILMIVSAAAVLLRTPAPQRRRVVVAAASSNGIFVGDEVRILTVFRSARSNRIEPETARVKITFWFDGKHAVPADARH